MTLGHCAREKEVMDLLRSGGWPAACEPELHEHVAACSLCAQTVMLKSAFAAALTDGEDFELILAVPAKTLAELQRQHPLSCELTCIGEFVAQRGLWQVDNRGVRSPLEPRGFQH